MAWVEVVDDSDENWDDGLGSSPTSVADIAIADLAVADADSKDTTYDSISNWVDF